MDTSKGRRLFNFKQFGLMFQSKIRSTVNVGRSIFVVGLFLSAGMLGQQAAAIGPGQGFQAQVGVIKGFDLDALGRPSSIRPGHYSNPRTPWRRGQIKDNKTLIYWVYFDLMPQVAQRGDVYLGGAYMYKGQGFGTHTPVKVSLPQGGVKNPSALTINHYDNHPVASDQIVFWLMQDGKKLVERAFPFNISPITPSTPMKLPDSSTVPEPIKLMKPMPR